MTKKHFEKIAELIKTSTQIHVDYKNDIVRNEIRYNEFINNLLEYFEEENINFNRNLFIKALGNLCLLNKDNTESIEMVNQDIVNKWEQNNF